MKIKKFIPILFYLIAIAVSIKSFREPDLWWQIRTGEWIIQHHEVPKQDVFSFTMNGTEWINIKWGFEVLAAFISDTLGPESVFILQAIVNCLLVFFLFKLSKLYLKLRRGEDEPADSPHFLFSGAIAFLILIAASEYRMIGRPEMISHLMTVIFIYLLEKNRKFPSRMVYILIPLQLLWTNLHEAFGTGLVILIIYTACAWLNKFLSKENNPEPIQLSLVTLGAAASVLINPNGVKLLTRPFNIMSQVYSNKYTTELLGITSAEWWKKEAYLSLLLALVSIFTILSVKAMQKKKSAGSDAIISRLNNPYLITILAFSYLGITAYRNLIFLSLVCFPVFHYSIYAGAERLFGKSKSFEKYSSLIAIVLLLLFYTGIVSNRYYKMTGSRDRFGLEVLSINNPVGAADFIQQHHLENKKCFSDYLTSSYLMWKLQPEFKTYIDLRDLDIFPPEFFNRFLTDVNSPPDFHSLDSVQHFDYAVVFRPQFDALHSYLYNDSVYALKYVDAVAAVYEKTDDFSREDIFSRCGPVRPGIFATAINKILNPFYSSFNYEEVENDYIAATYYLNVNRYDLVKKRAESLISSGMRYKGNEILGQLYFRSSVNEKSDSVKSAMLASAEEYYQASLRDNKEYAPALLGIGVVRYNQQNYSAAVKDFQKCLSIDQKNYQAHLSIAQCYREMMNANPAKKEDYRKEVLKHFLEANSLNPGNPLVLANIGFVYFQMNDCDHAAEYLSGIRNDKSLGEDDRQAVGNCLRQCGK
jgi:tetratricopeptide (TPR) repeat protein